ncbi:FecCD family ABC transporter permease [Halonatronum saccharophilum]|uniref:FecCD family ABC transporter permease n=1 Tax=Halonatronum saccharophilum TaxID=150060 RepID=UPI000486ED6F|nr:iron chelate uptake ABC transporter family permease subunit [Halonatronum saccharophilum]
MFRRKEEVVFLILFMVLGFSIIIALSSGVAGISFLDLLKGELSSIEETILIDIRLPRVILAGLVGLALASSGVAFQGLFNNVMADPYIIGISAGASLGAVIAINFGLDYYFLGIGSVPLLAFLGAILATLGVYTLAWKNGRVSIPDLLLSGVAISFFLSALVSLLMIVDTNSLQKVFYWLMGSLTRGSWTEVRMIWLPILIAFFILYLYADKLNIILLGEENALYLGVNVERVKVIILILGSLLTGTAVAVSGVVGFIGLMVPHIMRLIVGANHKILLPAAALGGASFLILTDTLARTILAPTEIPVGIITALCGGPFFLYLLRKRN